MMNLFEENNDPFKSEIELDISVIKTRGRKRGTIIKGFKESEFNIEIMKKLCKKLKKHVCGNGKIGEEKNYNKSNEITRYIMLQGEHIEKVREFLINNKIVNEDNIKKNLV